jgi:hypothetical protein
VNWLRRVHLYLGCFFAPLLLFFVATGWYQVFHQDRQKTPGEAETWVSRLTSVHKDQIYPTDSANAYSPALFRVMVVLMSVAFIGTVVLGVVLALRSSRRPWIVWLLLGSGLVVPALLLWLGQKR